MRDALSPRAFLSLLAAHRRHLSLTLISLAITSGGLNILEQLSIAYMDRWLPVTSMEQAEWYSIAISTFAESLRISLVGIAIYFVARPLAVLEVRPLPPGRFLGYWIGCAVVLGVALLGLDTIGYLLQLGTIQMDGEAFRAAFLLLIYAKILAYYFGLRWLFGAGRFASAERKGLLAAWKATTLTRSLLVAAGYLALWLAVEGVILPILSYAPIIAPFWFIPDQTTPHQFLVGQGTRILAEALAMILYVLVWVITFGETIVPATSDTGAKV